MSLYIAISCSHETRAKLSSFNDELRSHSESGSFSCPEHFHLTLAFLGECNLRQTAITKHAMDSVRFEPFSIMLAGGGYLGKGRPNLVFCSLKNDNGYDKLRRLQSELEVNLSAKGLALNQRKFWPHITLGREVVWKDIGKFSSFVDISFPMIEERVTSIVLVASERVDDKLTYTPIFEKELLCNSK